MIEAQPDIFNVSAAQFSETTLDVLQSVADKADLLKYLDAQGDLSEAEALNFAESAHTALVGISDHDHALSENWHAAQAAIDPSENPVDFLAWDGMTEPEDMRSARLSLSTLRAASGSLNLALMNFVFDTYVHQNFSRFADDTQDTQKEAFRAQVIASLSSSGELPLTEGIDERYQIFVDTALRKAKESSVGKLDMFGLLTRSLQERRREFNPEYSATRKVEIYTEAQQARLQLDELWGEVLASEEELLDTHWMDLRDTLLNTPNQVAPSDIDDAVKLLARIEPSLRSQTPSDWENRGYRLHRFLEREQAGLHIAKNIALRAGDIEDASIALTPIQGLQPRLNSAVIYLYHQSGFIETLTKELGTTHSMDGYGLQVFLRGALRGPTDTSFTTGPDAKLGEISSDRAEQLTVRG